MQNFDFWQFFLLSICVGWLALWHLWLFAWSRPDVERWATENGFRLVHWRRQHLLLGQSAYKITVEDVLGRKRTAIMHAPSVVGRFLGFGLEPKVYWLD